MTELYCQVTQVCEVVVKHDKEFHVQSHRNSSKHSFKLKRLSTSSPITQKFLSSASNFTLDVTNAFLAAGIPLHKLENPTIRNLFASMGRLCPSDSICRQYVPKLAEEEKTE